MATCFGRERPSPGQLRTKIKVQKNVTQWDPIEYYIYCTLIVVVSWPEDGRLGPKHVAKYHLTVIIASCLMYVVY